MHDTSPEIEKVMREMIQKKSPFEHLKMGCSMHATSKYLIIRAILEANPKISKKELKKEIFLRFYENDFDPVQREKILKHLEQC